MTLHIDVRGSGPDLVLLHGWGMNASIWEGLLTLLAPRFTVHSVDMPGHGYSVACKPHTLDAIVDELAEILPPRVMVCAWSLGGLVALAWALRRPAQLARMVLIATTPRFVRGPDWQHGIDGAVLDRFARDLAGDTQAALRRFFSLQITGEADPRAALRPLRKCMLAHGAPDAHALELALRILRTADLREQLAGIVQPVLLLHGERDALVPLAASAYCRRMLPNAELEAIAGAAHAPFVTRPRHVARRITEFCLGT